MVWNTSSVNSNLEVAYCIRGVAVLCETNVLSKMCGDPLASKFQHGLVLRHDLHLNQGPSFKNIYRKPINQSRVLIDNRKPINQSRVLIDNYRSGDKSIKDVWHKPTRCAAYGFILVARVRYLLPPNNTRKEQVICCSKIQSRERQTPPR
jgi:hypothetical protein